MKAILYPSILISISIISTTPSGIRFPDELEDGRRSRVLLGANVLVISFHPERQQSSHQFLMRRGRFTIKLALSLSPWGNWVGDTTANILPEKHVWLFKSLPLPLGAKVNVHIWIFSSVLSWYQAGQSGCKSRVFPLPVLCFGSCNASHFMRFHGNHPSPPCLSFPVCKINSLFGKRVQEQWVT